MLFHLLLNHYLRKMFDIPPPAVHLFSLRVLLLAGGSLLMENKKGISSAGLQQYQFPVGHDQNLNTITRKHRPNIYYHLHLYTMSLSLKLQLYSLLPDCNDAWHSITYPVTF